MIFGLNVEKTQEQCLRVSVFEAKQTILEYFEYFCQMSSKLILVTLSYTVSKLVRF